MERKRSLLTRSMALLIAMTTLFTGCASGSVSRNLYADEIDSTEQLYEEEGQGTENEGEPAEEPAAEDSPQNEKVLDLENESYLDVESLSDPSEFETEEDDPCEIDEDYKDVPSKGFLLKIDEGGTLMVSDSPVEFWCSVWYRDEQTGGESELEEIKDGYYCVPASNTIW